MSTQPGKIAVVFWGPHSLSSEMLAQRLHAPCYLVHYLGWKRPWMAPIKYPPMWLKTWWLLFRHRPSAVLVINTPVFAPLCVYIYCLLARIPFAMNVHGHTLSGRRWGWSRPLQRFLATKAAVNLVGTAEYRRIFENWGARTLLLEEAPPEAPQGTPAKVVGQEEFHVTVVSTFAGDEPLNIVVEAASRVPEVCIAILGDTKLADKELINSSPENVTFPGYLKGSDYWGLLCRSQAIMVLTTNPHSLVAGGTEGLHAGKPLILSRQPALVEYFTKGAIFVDHTVESIAAGIRRAQEQADILSRQSAELASEKRGAWEITFRELVDILGGARA